MNLIALPESKETAAVMRSFLGILKKMGKNHVIENIHEIYYLHAMEPTPTLPIGIMADSHGNNELLLYAITALKAVGAGQLFHLGDMCDSLTPHLITRAMDILQEHDVRCVRGNNECNILHDSRGAHATDDSLKLLSRLQELPYTIRLGIFWLTHSAPFSYPAATKRPISEFLPLLTRDDAPAFSILFRGHSHRPSIMEIRRDAAEKIPVPAGVDIPLDRSKKYIITVGAVESASSVLFIPREYSVRFVTVPKHHT